MRALSIHNWVRCHFPLGVAPQSRFYISWAKRLRTPAEDTVVRAISIPIFRRIWWEPWIAVNNEVGQDETSQR